MSEIFPFLPPRCVTSCLSGQLVLSAARQANRTFNGPAQRGPACGCDDSCTVASVWRRLGGGWWEGRAPLLRAMGG